MDRTARSPSAVPGSCAGLRAWVLSSHGGQLLLDREVRPDDRAQEVAVVPLLAASGESPGIGAARPHRFAPVISILGEGDQPEVHLVGPVVAPRPELDAG